MNVLTEWPGKADELAIEYDIGVQKAQLPLNEAAGG